MAEEDRKYSLNDGKKVIRPAEIDTRIHRIIHVNMGNIIWDKIQCDLLRKHFEKYCILPYKKDPTSYDFKDLFYNNNLFIWAVTRTSELLYVPKSFKNDTFVVRDNAYDCYKDKKDSRFIMIDLALSYFPNKTRITGSMFTKPEVTLSHANMLIFDTETCILERYDPHGVSLDMYKPEKLDKTIFEMGKFIFSKILEERKKPLKLSSGLDNCPRFLEQTPKYGPQIFQGQQRKFDIFDDYMRNKNKPETGFCSAWSFLYTYLRLSYPDLSPRDIGEDFMNPGKYNLWKIILRVSKFVSKVHNAYVRLKPEERIWYISLMAKEMNFEDFFFNQDWYDYGLKDVDTSWHVYED